MGDGGVACMPLQQHNTIMERFPSIQENTATTTTTTSTTNTSSITSAAGAATATLCATSTGGKTATNTNKDSKSNGSVVKNSSTNGSGATNGVATKPKKVLKKIIKVKKVVTVKKVVAADKSQLGGEKAVKVISKDNVGKVIVKEKEADNKLNSGDNTVQSSNNSVVNNNNKDDVEEGELGTLKWPPKSAEVENGEFISSEKRAVVAAPTRRSEIEKSEIKGEGILGPGRWRKGDFARDEVEKGEFIPDRWNNKDDNCYNKPSRGKYEMSTERTPPSGKYSADDIYRRKEFSRSGSSQHSKSSSRWENGMDRNLRISSKIVDEEGPYKSDYSNDKNYGREYVSGNRLKRYGAESDISERKHYGDYGDYGCAKSRRLSEDAARNGHPEHYSRHSVERFYRNPSSSTTATRISSLEKYTSRHHEPALPSKVVYDRHGRSPGHSERSPRALSRYYDHRGRSPARRERSPYRRERSPYVLEKSPYGRERSPYGRERSPYGRDRSPYGRERSPYGRERSPFCRERSPYVLERSPYVLEKSPYVRDRSPYARDKSPYDRSRHYDYRRSPGCSERSSQDRHYDRRDRTPNFSPLDRGRPNSHREPIRKGGASEKRNSLIASKGKEEKFTQKDSNEGDSQLSAKESQEINGKPNIKGLEENNVSSDSHKEEQSQSPRMNDKESPHIDGPPPEELLSMEEDMDICDTPPHVPAMADSSTGKWFYLDYFGLECGPAKISDLKALVAGGVLVADHLVKHLDSDRWLTIENAVSPSVNSNFVSIVSDTVTQLASPPEAPGNLLADLADMGPPGYQGSQEASMTSWQPLACLNDCTAAVEPLENLHIDERVGVLLEGFTVVPGRELETIGEVLQTTFEHVPWERCGQSEDKCADFNWNQACVAEQHCQNNNELSRCSDMKPKEAVEVTSSTTSDTDQGSVCFVDSADWFSGQWPCKGGDWKRTDETVQDRFSQRKLVLTDGYPLCQMPKSGTEDPRWHRKDDLYHPSQSRRLELPPWAFSSTDEKNECGGSGRTLAKPSISRGVKGTMLSVVRINACVVKDHGSFVSEPRTKVRGKDRYPSRSSRILSAANDVKRLMAEGDSQSRNDQDAQGSCRSISFINTPKDRICTVDDLQLHLGEWYYLDGSGHEQGPSSFAELQVLASQGAIKQWSSVFRKLDRVWVPVNPLTESSEVPLKIPQEQITVSGDSSTSSKFQGAANNENNANSVGFHRQHPQFIGYTCGKLHELVMKSFKSREFAAAINDVLDPWITAKQPKKEVDGHVYRKKEIDGRAVKRARLQVDGSDEDYIIDEDVHSFQKDETTFEELCGDSVFHGEKSACSDTELGSWGLLDGHMLARVFHYMRSDMKSLVFASLTCKHWRAAATFYKDITQQVDFSKLGPNCTDLLIWNIMNGYSKGRINSMVLVGCRNVTPASLEDILRSFPCLSSIDIRGCSQFKELTLKFPDVRWIKSRGSRGLGIFEESSSKIKSLNQISDRTPMSYKSKGLNGDTDDFSDLKEYFDSVNKRDSANQLFRRSLYKRSKLFDARRSSSIVSRDARMRRWAIKKSENGYKRMEGFIACGLKDIMKENTFDFFVSKVAEIEDKMKKGYYLGHGLRSVKEDISRMCRDAIKAKNRGAGDMNRIISLFLKLASRLEDSPKFSYERDELMKSWKDDLTADGYGPIKSKKKLLAEKKHFNRSNGATLDYGEYASDRDIRRRLSKLNRKTLESGSETSDGFDKSSEDGQSDSDSTASDTESDLDFQSESRFKDSRGSGFFMEDEGLDSMIDEREWGARMTKAGLVPPVTRKYEVIDHYVIVADEEDVQRKMCVSLPDDYTEKLDAQKNGTEDMELPEVKEYKPRKQLGDEVLEQEVYGIDPYTHNLLLDSMPEELDWSISEKYLFIEDMLLPTLNKQVRRFTGTSNTPMKYSLKPILEEIETFAEEDCDIRTMKTCQAILKAINSRRDDNYVAYRKGLGVVCNKKGGFAEEDFVVEFLGEVYPAWKWFEKQDGIRSLQKDSKEPAPEFYNIYLERPKGDADGFDLVVVDAMHKANYASRICHSCRPNCEAKVTAVDGQYQIGIYTVREIQYGEEITFDYNSVTESKEEYEASVCLCGSQVCRGSYLNLTGEGAFQKVLKEWHSMLDRHHLMLEACEINSVSEEDYLDLGRAGLGSCLLGGLPDWVVAYSARLVRFINLERTKLPEEILRHNLEEKRKYFSDICLEVEKSDAEVQAEGVYNQRLQNLAVTLDKVRYVMRCLFGDPKKAPPPLERLTAEETVSFLWKGEGSLVDELLHCMAPHVEEDVLNDLRSKICARDPSNSDNIQKELHKCLLWLRDEVRSLPCTYKCRHDAAADLIHVYAYTRCFFRVQGYESFTSSAVHISPLDLGPKSAEKLGGGTYEYRKTYGENYCMGQLIYWHIQTYIEPDCTLGKASRGCLSLPDISSFYAKAQKPSQQRIYGPKTVKLMMERMEKYPHKPWPKDQIWSFKCSPKVIGSPMLDGVLSKSPVDREMIHWLKHRPSVYQAMWDR
ncbi:histone-lysine N-methyltransferase ATXR3 [Mercurialis annua]|uniref:histone-lysine N-methyltransferase ATXR3 n=1 Tax=Mercurialis annua TaxID=3986 RepID=UPI002160CF89|nr:histone-lysine N-methyltransferase ATXR3 [Mercurialis annua]XP_050206423.1 histone-lysine N-methyltransferase ATXR3 [Mercurialis annua]